MPTRTISSPDLNAKPLGGAGRFDLGHAERTVRAVLSLRHQPVPLVSQPLHVQQPGRNGERIVDRNREADALCAGPHGDVDADHFAVDVQQRPARIARVDARVGLNQVVVRLRLADLHIAAQRADDAARDRLLIAEGVAERDHRFADHQVGRRAEADHGQRFGGRNLDHGQVGRCIVGDQIGDESPAVVERHFDPADVGHDVIIGQDVAAFVDDRAGAHAVHLSGRFRRIGRAAGSACSVTVFWPLMLTTETRALRTASTIGVRRSGETS